MIDNYFELLYFPPVQSPEILWSFMSIKPILSQKHGNYQRIEIFSELNHSTVFTQRKSCPLPCL